MSKVPKVVVFDIEILRDINKVDDIWFSVGNYPGLTLKASINSIINFGYKILDDKEAHVISAWDFPDAWQENVNDDSGLCLLIYDILHDADAVITHNGKNFDWKFIQTRLMVNGLPPLPKIPHIDTKVLAKSNLFMFNNKLDTISKFLTSERKMESGGQNLWTLVRKRNKDACAKMAKYCKQDVETTEAVFNKLKPFATNLPNRNLFDQDGHSCPSCGSKDVQKYGKTYTKTAEYQRYKCNSCHSISKSPLTKVFLR